MKKYHLSYRTYNWPVYGRPEHGTLRIETFEAIDDETAKSQVEGRKDFQTFLRLNHKGCRSNEYDYNGDFVLTEQARVVDLPQPPEPVATDVRYMPPDNDRG